jgi:hypothetical protein
MLNALVLAMILSQAIALWAASPVKAATICLKLEAEHGTILVPVSPGSELMLSFLHSIHGSSVQERFRVTPKGFQPYRLLYSDLRAAEYYGHGSARFQNDRWIVDHRAHDLPRLDLRVSDESFIGIALGDLNWLVQKDAALGTHLALSVTPCPKEHSGP